MKRILTILCALAVCMAGSGAALAAEAASASHYYPVSVAEYTAGRSGEMRIKKIYQLSLSDDPSGIPTEDFERGGRIFSLLDLTRKNEIGVDTRDCTKTVTQPSETNDMEKVLQTLDAELEVTDEDGYTGTLRLDHTSVQVTADGYATKTQPLSASRSYPNLSEADVSLIPKSVTEGGKTLTLGDVQWSESPQTDGEGNLVTRYTATASYTGSSSYQYATGYTVTANYTGQVAKTECSVVTYTATFASLAEDTSPEAEPDETSKVEPDETEKTPPTEAEEPSGDGSEPAEEPSEEPPAEAEEAPEESTARGGLKRILLFGGVAAALAAGGVFVSKKIRRRR